MIVTLFGSRAFFGIQKQSRALASMVLKTPVREQLATGGGGGGGVQMENFQASLVIFSLSCGTRDRGGGANRIFSMARIHVQQHTELNTRLGAAGISNATEAFLIIVKKLNLK